MVKTHTLQPQRLLELLGTHKGSFHFVAMIATYCYIFSSKFRLCLDLLNLANGRFRCVL